MCAMLVSSVTDDTCWLPLCVCGCCVCGCGVSSVLVWRSGPSSPVWAAGAFNRGALSRLEKNPV